MAPQKGRHFIYEGGLNGVRSPDNKSLRKFVAGTTNLLAVVGTALDVPAAHIKVLEIGPPQPNKNRPQKGRFLFVLTGLILAPHVFLRG
jgi:hypothetical protein